MKKRRNWFSSMKSCCIPTKKRLNIVSANGDKKEKKGLGKLTQRKSNSFIPLFKQPSSIEKIFSDFEKGRENIEFRSPISVEEVPSANLPPRAASPIVTSPKASSPVVASPKVASPEVASPEVASPKSASPPRIILHQHEEISRMPEPTQINYHASATKIQAMFRGHLARRGFRALKGLVRLQGVVSGQNVKRQTSNAMKQMQRLVRVQSQIQSWRIQMMENQYHHNGRDKSDKEVNSSLSRSRQTSEAGNCKNWDDSFITKNERDARTRRKVEAIINRERAMSYAYSPELLQNTPKSAQETPTNQPSTGGDLRWCNWLERQLPLQTPKNFLCQTPRQPNLSPRKSEIPTPKSRKSTATKPEKTPRSLRSSPAKSISNLSRFSRQTPRVGRSLFDAPLNDDDSLVSCPPFLGPRYMAPTISFKAKETATLYSRERFLGTPNSQSNRRFSYPFTNESKFSKASNPNRNFDENRSVRTIESPVVASPASLPAGVGRRPFNRFV